MGDMSRPQFSAMRAVLAEVGGERTRQHDRFGEQNLPDGTASCALNSEAVLRARALCQDRSADGTLAYVDLLREEVAEAVRETDPRLIRAELIQVAAVAVQWVEAIDRRADVRD